MSMVTITMQQLLLLLLVLCLWCSSSIAQDGAPSSNFKLKQLHVLTRHGSRTMLAKDADNLAEEGGATLTPLGQKQLYDLGVWLRNNYNRIADDDWGLNLEHYNPARHRLESTNLDRTLSSASSLSMGLFPLTERASGLHTNVSADGGGSVPGDGYMLYDTMLPQAPAIPVYSMEDANDVYMRAFLNCPKFHDNLQVLYETDEWLELESSNRDLLRIMGRIFPEYADEKGSVPLKDIWNVYDPIHVAVTECGGSGSDVVSNGTTTSNVATDNETSSSCDALVADPTLTTAVSTSQFETLELLTERTEHLKYGSVDVAGNLLGSNLLWKILSRTADPAGEFFLYSAHAPTLLGLLSTLQAGQTFVNSTGGERFIDYGSALLVEVYRNDDVIDTAEADQQLYIKVRYKATDGSDAIDVALKETSPSSSADTLCGAPDWLDDVTMPPYCSLSRFTLWATSNTIVSEADWCMACENRMADVCMMQVLLELDESDGGEPWIIGLAFAGGCLSGLIMMGLVCLYGQPRHRGWKEHDNNNNDNRVDGTGSNDCTEESRNAGTQDEEAMPGMEESKTSKGANGSPEAPTSQVELL